MMWLTMLSIAAVVVLDQLSKWWATAELLPVDSIPLIPGVLQLRYALNDGAAFSILAGRQDFLILVTAAALLVMLGILLLGKAENALVHWSLAMIVGGGRSSYYLAQELLGMGIEVKIIERSRQRCEELRAA